MVQFLHGINDSGKDSSRNEMSFLYSYIFVRFGKTVFFVAYRCTTYICRRLCFVVDAPAPTRYTPRCTAIMQYHICPYINEKENTSTCRRASLVSSSSLPSVFRLFLDLRFKSSRSRLIRSDAPRATHMIHLSNEIKVSIFLSQKANLDAIMSKEIAITALVPGKPRANKIYILLPRYTMLYFCSILISSFSSFTFSDTR